MACVDKELAHANPALSLNAAEQRELTGRIEKRQMKEFMTVRSQ